MTLSDRTIVLFVTMLLAAFTLANAGVLEENNVFQEALYEYRIHQIANSVEVMASADYGYVEKEMTEPTYLRIENTGFSQSELTIQRPQMDPYTVEMDVYHPSREKEDVFYICIRKSNAPMASDTQQVRVENGTC